MTDRFLEVYLDTNNMCNLRCVMCSFSDPRMRALKKYRMPFPLFEKVAAELFPRAAYVALSCLTEPLMTRNFTAYLRHAGRFGVPRLEFVTNGMLLTNEHLTACIDAGLWGMAVSVDGGDRATYEAVCQGASWSTLDRVITRSLQVFSAAANPPRLRIIMTLIRDNFRTVTAAMRQFIAWGVSEVEIRETIIFPGIELEKRQLAGHQAELRDLLLETQQLAQEAGMPLTIVAENAPGLSLSAATQPPCPALERRVAVAANGDVMPCMLWNRGILGDLGSMSFDEIWNGEPRQRFLAEFRRDNPPLWCVSCPASKRPGEEDDSFFELLSKPAWVAET